MLNKADEIVMLFHKHLQDELSDIEQQQLDDLLASSESARKVFERINSDDELFSRLQEFYASRKSITEDELQRVFNRTLESANVVQMPPRKKSRYKWIAAASVLIIASLSYFAFFNGNKNSTQSLVKAQTPANDVAPGNYKAKLILSDGTELVLDSASFGQLAQQGGTIISNKDGQLFYETSHTGNSSIGYNILTTATGESYAAVLSDGSKIWLNSGSSIKYPISFSGTERLVEISGEVFLSVAKKENMPFKVNVKLNTGKVCEVEVLGTEFNIMAYGDEPTIQTTLLEGSIDITNFKDNVKKRLTPGQQAIIGADAELQVRDNVNTAVITAWKDQTFYFRNNDLKTIMRQLSRWYGIQVVYEGELPERTFTGMVGRNTNLSEVLKTLEQSNIHFRIEGKKVIVIP